MNNKDYIIATPVRRIIALLIDLFFLFIFFRFVLFAIFVNKYWDLNLNFQQSIILPLCVLFALFLFKDSFGGRSIGKIFLSIIVKNVTKDFSRPSLKNLFLRNLPLILFPLECFFILKNQYCRRIGDRWAGTFVLLIKNNYKFNNPIRWVSQRVLFFIFLLAVIVAGYFITAPIQVKKSYAYHLVTQELEADTNIAKKFGKIISYSYWPEFYYQDGKLYLNLLFNGEYFSGNAKISLNINENNKYSITKMEVFKKND